VFEFRDEVAAGGACGPTNLRFVLPEALGGGFAVSRMTGFLTTVFGSDGAIQITALNAWIASLRILVPPDAKTPLRGRWLETGRMQARLADVELDAKLHSVFESLNVGRIDWPSGAVLLSWAAELWSPVLWRLKIAPILVAFRQFGFYHATSGTLAIGGTGLVVNEIFYGTKLLLCDDLQRGCTLTVSAPNPLEVDVNNRVIAKINPAPAPAVPVTFTAAVRGLGDPDAAPTVTPATVITNASGVAATNLVVRRVRRRTQINICAAGGGQCDDIDRLVGAV
jgi:hypothetical protein